MATATRHVGAAATRHVGAAATRHGGGAHVGMLAAGVAAVEHMKKLSENKPAAVAPVH